MKPILLRGQLGATGPTGPMHPSPQPGPTGPMGLQGAEGSTGPRGESMIDIMFAQVDQLSAMTFSNVQIRPSLRYHLSSSSSPIKIVGSESAEVFNGKEFTYSEFPRVSLPGFPSDSALYTDDVNKIKKVTLGAVINDRLPVGSTSEFSIFLDNAELSALPSTSGFHRFNGKTTEVKLKQQPLRFDNGLTSVEVSPSPDGTVYLVSDTIDLRSCLSYGGYTIASTYQNLGDRRNYVVGTYWDQTLGGYPLDFYYSAYCTSMAGANTRLFTIFPSGSPSNWTVIDASQGVSSWYNVTMVEGGPSVGEPIFTENNVQLTYPLTMFRTSTVVGSGQVGSSTSSGFHATATFRVEDLYRVPEGVLDKTSLSSSTPSFIVAKVENNLVSELVFLIGCTHDNGRIYAQAIATIPLHTVTPMRTDPVVNSFTYPDATVVPNIKKDMMGDSYRVTSSLGTYDRIFNFSTYRYTPCSVRVFMNYVDKLRKKIRTTESYKAWWNTYGGSYVYPN